MVTRDVFLISYANYRQFLIAFIANKSKRLISSHSGNARFSNPLTDPFFFYAKVHQVNWNARCILIWARENFQTAEAFGCRLRFTYRTRDIRKSSLDRNRLLADELMNQPLVGKFWSSLKASISLKKCCLIRNTRSYINHVISRSAIDLCSDRSEEKKTSLNSFDAGERDWDLNLCYYNFWYTHSSPVWQLKSISAHNFRFFSLPGFFFRWFHKLVVNQTTIKPLTARQLREIYKMM